MHPVPKIWISSENPSLSWLEHADATVICPSFCTVNRISSKKNQTYCLKSWQYLFGAENQIFCWDSVHTLTSLGQPFLLIIMEYRKVFKFIHQLNYLTIPLPRNVGGRDMNPKPFFFSCDASPGFPFAKIISVGFLSMIERITSPCCIIQLCCYRVDIHIKLS